MASIEPRFSDSGATSSGQNMANMGVDIVLGSMICIGVGLMILWWVVRAVNNRLGEPFLESRPSFRQCLGRRWVAIVVNTFLVVVALIIYLCLLYDVAFYRLPLAAGVSLSVLYALTITFFVLIYYVSSPGLASAEDAEEGDAVEVEMEPGSISAAESSYTFNVTSNSHVRLSEIPAKQSYLCGSTLGAPFQDFLKLFRSHIFAVVMILAVVVGLFIFWPILVEGVCPDDSSYLSTRFTRSFMAPSCGKGSPCHVYFTVLEDLSTSIGVNFQSDQRYTDPRIVLLDHEFPVNFADASKVIGAIVISALSFGLDVRDNTRYVYWGAFTSLLPNKVYFVVTGDDGLWSKVRSFKTAPQRGSSTTSFPFSFVAGGDIDPTNPDSTSLFQRAALTSPLFAVVGGDLEYADAIPQCYRKVDHQLDNFDLNLRTPAGMSVPLISLLGNHDVISSYGAAPTEATFILPFFLHTSNVSASPYERPTFHSHLIGDQALFIILDTNHVASYASQVPWLQDRVDQVLQSPSPLLPLVAYHVPLYPSVRSYSAKPSQIARSLWGPLFDRANMKLAFEHHDHTLKRTFRLRNNTIDDSGTTYVGDGSWGKIRDVSGADDKRWYHAVLKSRTHVWSVNYHSDQSLSVQAIAPDDTILDAFTLP